MHVDSFSCPKLFTTDGFEMLLDFLHNNYRHMPAPQVILSIFLYAYSVVPNSQGFWFPMALYTQCCVNRATI